MTCLRPRVAELGVLGPRPVVIGLRNGGRPNLQRAILMTSRRPRFCATGGEAGRLYVSPLMTQVAGYRRSEIVYQNSCVPCVAG